MKKIIISTFIIFSMLSCKNNYAVILIEQPSCLDLNGENIDVFLAGDKIYSAKLKQTYNTSSYEEVFVKMKKGRHKLEVTLNGKPIVFSIEYPKDKFIILSPNCSTGEKTVSIYKKQ